MLYNFTKNRHEALNATNAFVMHLYKIINPKAAIYINTSSAGLFENLESVIKSIKGDPDQLQQHTYDFIAGDFPLGMPSVAFKDNKLSIKPRIQKNWGYILKALMHLSGNGLAVFNVEPSFFATHKGKEFKKLVETHGFFCHGLINTPKGVHSNTAIQDNIILISKIPSSTLFIGELRSSANAMQLAENYNSKNGTDSLLSGILALHNDFHSFYRFDFNKRLDVLETQYKEYKSYPLKTISKEINKVRYGEKYEEIENSIYIPAIGNSNVVFNLKDTTMKHQNYFQVVLDENIVIAECLEQFFISKMGKLVLKSINSVSTIPRINKKDLIELEVAIPPLLEQKNIISTASKLQEISYVISQFYDELALNPKNSKDIHAQLDKMLVSLKELSDEDRVKSMLREGETKNIEFKQTLSLNLRTQTKDKNIIQSALKTVVAFLNTDGGHLLIGVDDCGQVVGIEEEMQKFDKSKDKYLQRFASNVKRYVGEDAFGSIAHRTVEINNKMVLLVECMPSNKAIFISNVDFYIRTNPSTYKLEGAKLLEYVEERFKSLTIKKSLHQIKSEGT